MNLKVFFFAILTLFLTLSLPTTAKAISLQDIQGSGESFLLRAQEEIQYFFAFQNEKKIAVLEQHAEKRMLKAQEFAEDHQEAQAQNMLKNYLRIRTKQIDLLSDLQDGEVLGAVADNVIQEQQTMETIKTQFSEDGKRVVMQTQEQVVNQVAQHIVVVNGPEGQTKFFQEVEHVWAPGTGPGGGEAGVVIEGGEMRWAPGTGPGGGESGVKYEGGSGTVILQDGDQNQNAPGTTAGGDSGGSQGGLAPGTTADGGNNTVETNVIDNVESTPSEGDTWLAP